ncbi:hypothetical protein M758_10G020800 [Ceratodon purpureus]|uniref:Uncharacterized protein n=1 Tax=Ceratodon purpureus TaxID=3225 RepID=A0A8T0GGD5_CERPU|nr:hypothetical protein KC19_10G022700 [Ceratodon purpureus]KAG0602534.1 hypothetical protein M758_10G020800 [Ceratodon purpureus]
MERRMFAAILLISSIAGGGVIQLTNAQYEGEELRLNPTGIHKRTEWPEMLHKNLTAIFEHFMETLGSHHHFDFGIFIQKPLPKVQHRPQNEKDSDVWLYLTHDDIVYEIPRHGRWHPNRINPGWPELKGVHYKDAIQVIMHDMPGVLVDYGPLKRLKPKGTEINRVVLYIDDNEKVARVPNVG